MELKNLFSTKYLKTLSEKKSILFRGVFLLKKISIRVTRNRCEFLVLEISDKKGSIFFNCFKNATHFEKIKNLKTNTVLYIKGYTDFYQGKFSPSLIKVKSLTNEEISKGKWLQKLIPSSPEDCDKLWDTLQKHINNIEHVELKKTVKRVMEEVGENFRFGSAAISMHHAYRHGLLEHTTHMASIADALFPIYPEVNKDLAMAGIILHDIGKVIEYENNYTIKKTRIGSLQGHVVLGYRITRKAALQSNLEANLCEQLEHIILSHQGEMQWGAAVIAATPEAIFVAMIDNFDAKMGMVQKVLRDKESKDEFSYYIEGLQTKILTTSS